MTTEEKILISQKEHNALTDIRGMPDAVHSMIYSAGMEKGQYVLSGDDETFEDLLSLIGEEIGEEFCPRKNIPALLGVCKKVNPESLDWIGQ